MLQSAWATSDGNMGGNYSSRRSSSWPSKPNTLLFTGEGSGATTNTAVLPASRQDSSWFNRFPPRSGYLWQRQRKGHRRIIGLTVDVHEVHRIRCHIHPGEPAEGVGFLIHDRLPRRG